MSSPLTGGTSARSTASLRHLRCMRRPAAAADFTATPSGATTTACFRPARSFRSGPSGLPGENFHGVNLVAPMGSLGAVSLGVSQNRIRGNVNGNVLIPLPEERTSPCQGTPATRAAVQRILDGYPDVPPNRPDIAARAHNTNSLQRINTDSSRVQLDRDGGRGRKSRRPACLDRAER